MSTTIEETFTPSTPAAHAADKAQRTRWARDFAIVGASSSFLAPCLIVGGALGPATLIATTLAGGATGAALGALLRRPLAGALGATPWPLIALLMLAIGAAWGAVVGAVGATVLGADAGGYIGPRSSIDLAVYTYFMGYAAIAAALQLAWFGVAYARADRVGVPTWPLVVAALGTPFLGWAGLHVLSLGLSTLRAL